MPNLLSSGSPARAQLLGYGVAVLSIAAALANVLVLQTTAPISSYMLAVILSAWFGGTRPAVLAIAASAVALTIQFQPGDLPRLGYFLLICAFLVWIIASERKAAEALRRENIEGKALEDLLRRNETELRLVIDTIPTMAWSLHPDGRLEFLNQRWLEYSGLTLQDALANSNSIIHPDDSAKAIEKWRQIMVSGEGYDDEMRLRRADGEYRWFLVRTVPLLDDKGRILRWFGTSTDIEDRKRAEGDRRRAEQALRESAERLQYLSRRLLEVQEQERRHLSRELHDEFGQLLAGVKLHLHVAKTMAGAAAQPKLDESIALLERAGEQVRSLVLALRPTLLETAGLDGTLRWLARQHEQQTGISTRVVGEAGDVAGELATACFRVAQEALTNVVRHARARNVWIEVSQGDGAMELAVRDDGDGFDVAGTLEHAAGQGHLGLLGMRERVEILGGALRVDSRPGQGTRVLVSFPTVKAGVQPAEPVA